MAKSKVPNTTDREAIIDMDGVLIDNSAFELAVTEFVIRHISEQLKLAHDEARDKWNEELAATRNDVRWFDYDFHCLRLGVTPVSQAAHRHSLQLLSIASGAAATWSQLLDRANKVTVATDATEWVARLKLSAVGLDGEFDLWSSAGRGGTKSSTQFWTRLLQSKIPNGSDLVVIDNRLQNLMAAWSTRSDIACVQFDGVEHVTTLDAPLTPHDHQTIAPDGGFVVVSNHDELQRYLEARWQ